MGTADILTALQIRIYLNQRGHHRRVYGSWELVPEYEHYLWALQLQLQVVISCRGPELG